MSIETTSWTETAKETTSWNSSGYPDQLYLMDDTVALMDDTLVYMDGLDYESPILEKIKPASWTGQAIVTTSWT